ncbi:MAG: Gfo/Idh/MocA family oxidoreductase, partial [Candidatus Latescibacteria bacterium]|nr:Gfo/Idh/MocA family oxidoreductase [Candidatus Latescibacterota bacterium]
MSEAKAIRVGVIGCGGRGKHHLQRLSEFDDVEVVGIADASADARAQVGETYGVERQFDEIGALLDQVEVDAVFLATPAHLNAPTAAISLERGVDTLLEKPPGLSAEETRRLRDVAATSGARGMVAWDRRFNPWIVEARAA